MAVTRESKRRRPHEGDHRLADHGPIEHLAAHSLAHDALRYHGGLGGVEAGDGPAGHGDEHIGPDGRTRGAQVSQGDLRDGELAAGEEDAADDGCRHGDEQHAEDGIELADELVDGEERGGQVVDQDHHRPKGAVHPGRGQLVEEPRGAGHEHRAAKHQQDHGEHPHDPHGPLAEICAGQLRDGCAAVAGADHARHIVMDRAAQYGPEHDPEEHHRPEHRAHEGPEDGPGPGDVQELDQKRPPRFQGHAIHAVVYGHGGGLSIVGGKHRLRDPAIYGVAEDQH